MPFPETFRRLVLRTIGGASIILDSSEAVIRIFDSNGTLVYELDGDQIFFGDNIVNQKFYDSLGVLRTQVNPLAIIISGDDGTAVLRAASSGTDLTLPQLALLPPGAVLEGRVKSEAEANNGASTTIESPTYSTHDRAQIVMHAETDLAQPIIDLIANVVQVSNRLDIQGKAIGYAEQCGQWTGFATTNSLNTYQVIAGTTPVVTLVKSFTDTRIALDMTITAFANVVGTFDFGVRISGGGGDHLVGKGGYNVVTQRGGYGGHAIVPAFAAGSRTYTPIYKRTGGAGTVALSADDMVTLRVREISEA